MKKILYLSFFLLLFALPVEAASLFLSPPSGTYNVGNSFSVTVKVDSNGQAVNAAEGALIFNSNELQVTSLSKTGSIFSLWTTEPTFSNSGGNIIFAGGAPTAYTGGSGSLVTINFKAKAAATAQVSFSSGSVLAADGLGTNILANINGGTYVLKSASTVPVAPVDEGPAPVVSNTVPSAPVIISSTHADEEEWSSNNNPQFSWALPADVTGVSVLLHQKSTADPGPYSDGLITSKGFEGVEDGIWYVHVKFKNEKGWSKITHRQVLIDTKIPESFELTVDNEGDSTNPSPILHFKSQDELSGIEYYEVKINETGFLPLSVASLEHNPYRLPTQEPGSYKIIAKAVDKAGNETLASLDVKIDPIASPVITEYTQRLKVGEKLEVKGTAPANMTVNLFIKKLNGETVSKNIEPDSQKVWNYSQEGLIKGTYEIWAQSQDSRGAKSYPTEKKKVTISLSDILEIGKIALDYAALIALFVVILAGMIGTCLFVWLKFANWKRKINKNMKGAEESLKKAFKVLNQETKDQIEMMDKKPGMTEEEKKLYEKLQEALKISEKYISKNIKNVQKINN